MDHEQYEHLQEAVFDADSKEQREAVLGHLEGVLHDMASTLQISGFMIGPDRQTGVSTTGNADEPVIAMSFLIHTAHALVSGARSLVAANPYAASALVRQLVEVEYLAWAASEDPEEARDWLVSTPEARRARWQPRHLRKRAGDRFSAREYWLHCEAGGHPTPQGVRTFIIGPDRDFMVELVSWEVAMHGYKIWRFARDVLVGHLLLAAKAEEQMQHFKRWLDADQMNNPKYRTA